MSLHVAAPKLLSVVDATRIVLEHASPLGTEDVALANGVGRVLARDLIAPTSLPPFDNSAMDGYAVRLSDTAGASREHPVKLTVVGEVAAGQVFPRAVTRSQAVKIMTGAPLPPGADSVVMLEEARLRGDLVEIFTPVTAGSHVRPAGEDIREGERVLTAGSTVGVRHLGLLAGLGFARLPVTRVPRVAMVATGSELVDVGAPLAPGKIRNSNSLVLAMLLRRMGLEPVDLGVVADEHALIRRRLEDAMAYDVALICGGVSVGAHDLVKRILQELGMETLFWRVNMKPGKPLLFGRRGSTVVFGLPGNPISCVVGFLEFIAPWLRKTIGMEEPAVPSVHAVLTQALRKKEPRTQLFTAQLRVTDGHLTVTPTPQQGSGMLNSLAQANAFILVPETVMQLDAGAVVEVHPFGGDEWL